jgi:nucleotide-binding universal stress UspA family protein
VTAAAERVFDRILAGTDGSERATEAVRRAARIAALLASPLDVVFVIDTHRAHDEDVERGADAALATAEEVAGAEGADVRSRVVSGEPARTLIDEAVEHGAGLLALGPDAGLLGGAIRVGRVAAHVLRHAPVSVLLGRETPGPFPHRIECGIDGSESSVGTARLAARIASAAAGELRLQHVVPVFRGDNTEWTLAPDEESPSEIDDAVREVRSLGVEPVRAMAMGRPEHALVETARRDHVDLIVVGHRGASGMARVLLGSVSEHVALHASCSVLVARTADASRSPAG